MIIEETKVYCDICGCELDPCYYQNHWIKLKGVYHTSDSCDDSFKIKPRIICEHCIDLIDEAIKVIQLNEYKHNNVSDWSGLIKRKS